ncbi:hypothetical protein L9F63_024421, partial [Diploptera punctata]
NVLRVCCRRANGTLISGTTEDYRAYLRCCHILSLHRILITEAFARFYWLKSDIGNQKMSRGDTSYFPVFTDRLLFSSLGLTLSTNNISEDYL